MDLEQAPTPVQQTTVKAKDPKKQEAGGKGAMARRQKLESTEAELAATKKRFST